MSVIRSRDDWRTKTVQRADELREHRKTHKRNRAHIAELKQQIDTLQQAVEVDKKTLIAKPVVDLEPSTRSPRFVRVASDTSLCFLS